MDAGGPSVARGRVVVQTMWMNVDHAADSGTFILYGWCTHTVGIVVGQAEEGRGASPGASIEDVNCACVARKRSIDRAVGGGILLFPSKRGRLALGKKSAVEALVQLR